MPLLSNGSRFGIFHRTEQFSDILRFLNAFMQLQFPEGTWSSLCVSHNVRTRLHTDAGNKPASQNHTLSLGNFSGGEVWVCRAPDAKAPLTQAPHDSASAAHPEATRLGTTLDTWHTPTSFACESLHCTVPWQGDRWVLTAYTCRDLEAFPLSQLAHLRSLGFPLPGPPNNDSPALPKEDVADSADALFLDTCCGASAPLSKELSSKGISCVLVDLLGNESLDLLCDSTYDDLLRLAFSGVIRYAHASPPCKEYSRLKLRPGGPSAVRTPEHLDGLPSNTPAQQSRVISSQKLLYRSVCILRAVFSAGGHVSLEQPTNAICPGWNHSYRTCFLSSRLVWSTSPLAQWART